MSINNLYLLSTATSVENSGSGSNVLTKPAGTEVASVVPGKKYSVHIPTPATFTTDFNADVEGFSISLYTKPEPGPVLNAASHTITYTGYSYILTNEVSDKVEIPVSSHRAVLLVMTFSAEEVGLSVNGVGDSVPSNTQSSPGPLLVTLLGAGGILDHVAARVGVISQAELQEAISAFTTDPAVAEGVEHISDSDRDFTVVKHLDRNLAADPWTEASVELPSSDCLSFKVTYLQTGPGTVMVNGYEALSGFSLLEVPKDIRVSASDSPVLISDIVVTEYYSEDLGASAGTITTTGATGEESPIHLHDNNAATTGATTFSLDEPVNTVSGWFYAQDGAALPGVSVYDGKLINTDFTGEMFEQATAPEAGTSYRWTGGRLLSASEKLLNGAVVDTNLTVQTDAAIRGLANLTRDVVWDDESWSQVQVLSNGHGVRALADLSRLTNGTMYTGSYEVANSGEKMLQLASNWSNVSGDGMSTTSFMLAPGQRARVYARGARATYDNIYRFIDLGIVTTNTDNGDTVLFKKVMVTEGTEEKSYFDGDTPDDNAGDIWINTSSGDTVNAWNSSTNSWTVAASPAGVYVNGKPYVNGVEIKDWYFLTKTGATSGEFTTTVPVHSYTTSADTLNAGQVDDLYESFFGNPVLTAATETLGVTELPAMVISTEWSIVTSG